MLVHPRYVFLQALFLTIVLFSIGFLIGVAFETNRFENINSYYVQSETRIIDSFTLNSLSKLDSAECKSLSNALFTLTDQIYSEAAILEEFEAIDTLSGNSQLAHERYTILRAFLWSNLLTLRQKCDLPFDSVVYLYEHNTASLETKASQQVWSKILAELKAERGSTLLLLPLSGNDQFASIEVLKNKFNVTQLPAIVINDRKVVYELSSSKELGQLVDRLPPQS